VELRAEMESSSRPRRDLISDMPKVLHELRSLFVKEIIYHRCVNEQVLNLEKCPDFSTFFCFRIIDLQSNGFIDKQQLIYFMGRFEAGMCEQKYIEGIFRRTNKLLDYKMTFGEFRDNVCTFKGAFLSQRKQTCQVYKNENTLNELTKPVVVVPKLHTVVKTPILEKKPIAHVHPTKTPKIEQLE
jgi:hypothetical protein